MSIKQIQTAEVEQRNLIGAEATTIAKGLMESAWRHEGEASWFSRRMIWPVGFKPSERPTVELLGIDWQNGTLGVANFLLDAKIHLNLDGADEVAEDAVRFAFSRRKLLGGARRNGFNAGKAGLVWMADRLARFTDKPEWFDARDQVIQELWDTRNDSSLIDMMVGDAGAVATLTTILTHESPPKAEELASFLADRIVSRANVSGDKTSWPVSNPGEHTPDITGISHGASGTGLALCAANKLFDKPNYAVTGLGAFEYERQHQESDGWLDLRNERTPNRPFKPRISTGWCYGAPGFGVARSAAYRLMPTHHELRDEAIHAGNLTSSILADWSESPGTDSCLCHGIAGNSDALLAIGEHLDDKVLVEKSKNWANWALARYGAEQNTRWPNALPIGEFPALMTGVAGVGHWLLRLNSETDRSPTALLPPLPI